MLVCSWRVGLIEGATELDAMDGGRRVTRADVKAWLKNRCLLLLLLLPIGVAAYAQILNTDRRRKTHKLAARSSAHLLLPVTKGAK